MAVFCSVTGKRIQAPSGDYHERADSKAYQAAHNKYPVCKDVDPENGWEDRAPDEPRPSLKDQLLEALTEPKPAAPQSAGKETSQKPASKGGK